MYIADQKGTSQNVKLAEPDQCEFDWPLILFSVRSKWCMVLFRTDCKHSALIQHQLVHRATKYSLAG